MSLFKKLLGGTKNPFNEAVKAVDTAVTEVRAGVTPLAPVPVEATGSLENHLNEMAALSYAMHDPREFILRI